jgi:hypothetical protein
MIGLLISFSGGILPIGTATTTYSLRSYKLAVLQAGRHWPSVCGTNCGMVLQLKCPDCLKTKQNYE